MSSSQEYIHRRIKFFRERIEARSTRQDPITKQFPYLHPESQRAKDIAQIKSLEQSLVFQIQQDARMAQEQAAQRTANEQRERDLYEQNQAIRQRANAIRLEREAQKMADSAAVLSGPGSEPLVMSNVE